MNREAVVLGTPVYTTFAGRLGAVTGHPVSLTGAGGNFAVMILSEDDRAGVGPRVSQLVPGIPPADVEAWLRLAPSFGLQVVGPPILEQPRSDVTGGLSR